MNIIRFIFIAAIVVAAPVIGLFAVNYVWGADTLRTDGLPKGQILRLRDRVVLGTNENYAPLPAIGFTCPKCGGALEYYGEPCPGYSPGRSCAVLHGSWKCPKCDDRPKFVPNARDSSLAPDIGPAYAIAPGLVQADSVMARIDSLSAIVRRLEREVRRLRVLELGLREWQIRHDRAKESKAKADGATWGFYRSRVNVRDIRLLRRCSGFCLKDSLSYAAIPVVIYDHRSDSMYVVMFERISPTQADSTLRRMGK